jgi:hypothetical protein
MLVTAFRRSSIKYTGNLSVVTLGEVLEDSEVITWLFSTIS